MARSDIQTDPASVAERITQEGEPEPGSSSSRWSEERRAAASERMRAKWKDGTAPRKRPSKPLTEEQEKERKRQEQMARMAEPITPQEVRIVGNCCAFVWALAGPSLKLRELSQEQSDELGKAVIPVLRKYLPGLEDWSAEITLGMTLLGLYQANRIAEERKVEAPWQEVDGGNG